MISLIKPYARGTGAPSVGTGMFASLVANLDPSRNLIDRAAVGAKSAANTAYGAMVRNMSRMGVNANSPRFAAQMKDWAANRAATEAGARNDASIAGNREAYANRFSLWNAMNANEQTDRARAASSAESAASRAMQMKQAETSRQATLDDELRRRQWALSDQTAASKREAAEKQAIMSALDSYNMQGIASRLTEQPMTYRRELARTNLPI